MVRTFHRGENVPTAVRTPTVRNTSHRGGNVSTAVRMFSPRSECSHRGGNIPTAVRSKNKK